LRLQKAQYQAKVKKPARAREELPKLNAEDELEDAWEEELEDASISAAVYSLHLPSSTLRRR
jgi:hypothetical protein